MFWWWCRFGAVLVVVVVFGALDWLDLKMPCPEHCSRLPLPPPLLPPLLRHPATPPTPPHTPHHPLMHPAPPQRCVEGAYGDLKGQAQAAKASGKGPAGPYGA